MAICTKNDSRNYTSLNVTCLHMSVFTNTKWELVEVRLIGRLQFCAYSVTKKHCLNKLSVVFKNGARMCVMCQSEFMVSVI
jgi:hypothetical protein